MAKTKRVQVLMEPSEFELVTRIARAQNTSVGDLLRSALRELHLARAAQERRFEAAKAFLAQPDMDLPSWPDLKKEIEERYEQALFS
jgi:hypothetical protein